MHTYCVVVPCVLSFSVEIEANDKEEAIEKALDIPFTCEMKSEDGYPAIMLEQIDCHRQIVEGNCFHGHLNKAEVYSCK